MELELERASNFRVVNIFGGVRVRDCKFQWKTKINWNRLEIIIVDLSQKKKYGKKINWNYLII